MSAKRKLKRKNITSLNGLYVKCPICNGNGYTTTTEYIDRPKYKGFPQQVKHECKNCDRGYVPYKN